MTDYDFFDPESAESFFDQEKEILRSGKPVINQVRQESWKNGSTTWSSTSKVPLRLESGEPIGILGISANARFGAKDEIVLYRSKVYDDGSQGFVEKEIY